MEYVNNYATGFEIIIRIANRCTCAVIIQAMRHRPIVMQGPRKWNSLPIFSLSLRILEDYRDLLIVYSQFRYVVRVK